MSLSLLFSRNNFTFKFYSGQWDWVKPWRIRRSWKTVAIRFLREGVISEEAGEGGTNQNVISKLDSTSGRCRVIWVPKNTSYIMRINLWNVFATSRTARSIVLNHVGRNGLNGWANFTASRSLQRTCIFISSWHFWNVWGLLVRDMIPLERKSRVVSFSNCYECQHFCTPWKNDPHSFTL